MVDIYAKLNRQWWCRYLAKTMSWRACKLSLPSLQGSDRAKRPLILTWRKNSSSSFRLQRLWVAGSAARWPMSAHLRTICSTPATSTFQLLTPFRLDRWQLHYNHGKLWWQSIIAICGAKPAQCMDLVRRLWPCSSGRQYLQGLIGTMLLTRGSTNDCWLTSLAY